MALRDPVAVFIADTNIEAQLVRTLLVDAGIEAFVVEDVSFVGTCAFGTLPEINRPQIWVEREDVEKAWAFLNAYEGCVRKQASAPAVGHYCYHCGEQVPSGAAACAACGHPLDVPGEAPSGGREHVFAPVAASVDDDTPSGPLATFREFKKPLAWLFLIGAGAPLLLVLLSAILEVMARLAGRLQ